MAISLLEALLRNESGGRNIPNVTQGTSSGQAQGYFQITTGTWNDFGGQQFAPTPLQATYAQQAAIASKIPLKRWDESTVARMRATGKAIDPNRTLGENLAMNNESFSANVASTATPRREDPRRDTPSSGKPVGSQLPGPLPTTTSTPTATPDTGPPPVQPPPDRSLEIASLLNDKDPWSSLASGMAASLRSGAGQGLTGSTPEDTAELPPEFETAQAPLPPPPLVGLPGAAQGTPMTDLGDIFRVDPSRFGQAAILNVDRMGQPIRTRQYG